MNEEATGPFAVPTPSRGVVVFHLAGGADDSPGRPIYEYVLNLVAAKKALDRPGMTNDFFTFDNFDWRRGESGLAAEIGTRARALGARPVVLLHTVLPFVGAVVSPEFLDRFPSIVFPHQFKLLPEADRRRTFEYIRRAHRCLVTSRIEREEAVLLARETGLPGTARIAERFVTVEQPPGILPVINGAARRGDVAVFGMIRRGKGLGDVLRLAEEMRRGRRLAGKTLHVLGHATDRPDSLKLFKILLARTYGLGLEVRHRSPRAVRALVGEIRGTDPCGRLLAGLSLAETRELLRLLEEGRPVRDGEGGPAAALFRRLLQDRHDAAARLPIRLHVSLSGRRVSEILGRCTYGYLPVVGGELELVDESLGLSLHSSAAPTLAAHHLVLLAPIGSLTPAELRDGALVDVHSAAQAAAAIRRLDRDPAGRQAHVARSAEWAASKCWDRVAAAVVETCRQAARNGVERSPGPFPGVEEA